VVIVQLKGHLLERAHLPMLTRERIDLLKDVGEIRSNLGKLLGGQLLD